MTSKIENENESFAELFRTQLRNAGAKYAGEAGSLPRIRDICPEFIIRIFDLNGKKIYISEGCSLFSDNYSSLRNEFVLEHIENADISEKLLSLVCYYHMTCKSLMIGDTFEIGSVIEIPNGITHVVIRYPSFLPESVNTFSVGNLIHRLLYIYPINFKQCSYIKEKGIDQFEEKINSHN